MVVEPVVVLHYVQLEADSLLTLWKNLKMWWTSTLTVVEEFVVVMQLLARVGYAAWLTTVQNDEANTKRFITIDNIPCVFLIFFISIHYMQQ